MVLKEKRPSCPLPQTLSVRDWNDFVMSAFKKPYYVTYYTEIKRKSCTIFLQLSNSFKAGKRRKITAIGISTAVLWVTTAFDQFSRHSAASNL